MAEPQNSRFSVNQRPKMKISPKMYQILLEFYRVLDLLKKKMIFLKKHNKFQDHTSNAFFNRPSTHLSLKAYPNLPRKGCRIDHLDGLGHFWF